jgi:glyoxylase-like metal-dependent hydrolase (beta-lactamase superfamily II)
MDLITDIGNRTYLIAEYFSDTKVGFQAFFIASERPALIEPGPPLFASKLAGSLKKLGYDAASLSYIIPTHIHADHCGGAGNLIQSAPGARILAHRQGAKHLVDIARMERATRASWSQYYESEIGNILPVPESRIELVDDGDTINLGDRVLTVIYTPGHAKHHICLYDKDSGDLFSGEALGFLLPGDEIKVIPVVSPPVFEVAMALDSINKLRMFKISRILYSHYGSSQHVEKCLDLAEQSIKTWGDTVLQALMAGRNRAEIKASLAAYLDGQRSASGIFSQLLEWAIDGYTGYFIREGMVAADHE